MSVISLTGFADTYTLTPKEEKQIFEESEDWIDDMPTGLQDRISDAVMHALRGFNNELVSFRTQPDVPEDVYPNVNVKEVLLGQAGDMKVRVYKSKSLKSINKIPTLIYFHGGGWTMGSLNASERFCRALAASGKSNVISVDYSMAPENSYNSIVSQCAEAIELINSNIKDIDHSLVSLGGDGAGANLAINAYLLLKSKKTTFNIKSLVLYYPLLSLDFNKTSNSWSEYDKGYGLDLRVIEAYSEAISGNNPVIQIAASPLKLGNPALKTFPPVLMITSGRDIVLDDTKGFADKLRRQGVKVSEVVFPGALHGFITDNVQNTAFKKAVEITQLFLTNK